MNWTASSTSAIRLRITLPGQLRLPADLQKPKTKYLEKPFIEDHFKLLTGYSEAPIIHSCAVILIATLG